MLKHAVIFLIATELLVECCQIELSLRSNTDYPFQFEAEVPSIKKKTDRTTMTKIGQQRKVKINGPSCSHKTWIFRTYKQTKDGKWVPAETHTAKLDGNGRALIAVNDAYIPVISDRIGVTCSEAVICARG
ncbi:unnamed protein product [Bursaphelenchus xylophilus]|uniref:(pine wood nematode) hypothetical protein n=1 Tax=Bursaphelenchus xylophilus TaxID=6326 RepID=A0A1I7SF11_BURXY|nr:unnamed protein product [Bursaphelenchus xylophilus]CAG9088838.1 unnamed protein product [Bursaphelenchus xylophilus]